MKSLRCRVGVHDYKEVEVEEHVVNPAVSSFTNAVCARCDDKTWLNWPPVTPGDGSFRDIVNQIEKAL